MIMDWFKHTQEQMNAWFEAQQQMTDRWLRTFQQQGHTQQAEAWSQSVNVWEAAVHRTLDAQNAWLSSWTDSFKNMDGLPQEARRQAEQGEAVLKQWTEMQRNLWKTWFDTVKNMQPAGAGTAWEQEARRLVDTWRESMQQAMEHNQELFRSMTQAAPATSDEEQA